MITSQKWNNIDCQGTPNETHHQWDFLPKKYLTIVHCIPLFHNINQSYTSLITFSYSHINRLQSQTYTYIKYIKTVKIISLTPNFKTKIPPVKMKNHMSRIECQIFSLIWRSTKWESLFYQKDAVLKKLDNSHQCWFILKQSSMLIYLILLHISTLVEKWLL